MAEDLDTLLTEARDAEPSDRIELRNPIAAHGEAAIDAMIDWVSDRRLAGFAVRVLEHIAQQPDARATAVAALHDVDRSELPSHVIDDLDSALLRLGVPARVAAASSVRVARPPGSPGRPGRGYWVMRTSPWERPFLWAEAQAGRLRQGWGTFDEQNLEVIADLLRRGARLSDRQQEARRALRMVSSWWGGMRLGDIVIAPNLPEYGRLSVFRVAGSYYWEPVASHQFGERFGHVLPVQLLLANLSRHDPTVADGLRSVLRAQTRLYKITGYGGDVERLLGNEVSAPRDRHNEPWTEADYEALFRTYPPTGPRPSDANVEALAIELGRTPDAIHWQWEDGAAYLQGRSASTTSEVLKSWLDSCGCED